MQIEKITKQYETYKDSGIEWIGKIPHEWEILTLKRVFSNRDGGAWGEEPQNNENDRICIRIADFDYPKMTIKHDIDYTVRNYTSDVINKLTLQRNDILIEKSGGGEQTPVGRTIIFNESFNALYANFMDRLRVRQNILPKFIQYLLVSFYQNGITYQYIKQTTGIQNLDLTNLLSKEYVVLPNLEEQQSITDYLDNKCSKIDNVIETEKSVIEKLKEYKQSIITEAVTKGLDKSVPLKDSSIEWIGKIPQHWEIWKLSRLSKQIIDGTHSTPTYTQDGIPFLRVTDISALQNRNDEIDFENVMHIPTNEHEELIKRCKPEKGDLLVSKNGSIGIPKIINWDSPFSIFVSLCLIKVSSKVTVEYLYYYFRSTLIWTEIAIGGKTGTITNLHLDKIKEFKIPLPNIDEQKSIVEYLDKKCSEIDKAIADKEQVIEKFTEYKKSLIYECVTGKRKVVA